jgi:hypothetical protein
MIPDSPKSLCHLVSQPKTVPTCDKNRTSAYPAASHLSPSCVIQGTFSLFDGRENSDFGGHGFIGTSF